jgi:hypothetical protein
MDQRAVSLLRRFLDKESSGEVVTVTDFIAEEGVIEIRHDGQPARLAFADADLLGLLETAGEDASEVWGPTISDEESAARFLTIFLEESLATREPHPSGWWTYQDGGFDPVPPWEAHARRRHGS